LSGEGSLEARGKCSVCGNELDKSGSCRFCGNGVPSGSTSASKGEGSDTFTFHRDGDDAGNFGLYPVTIAENRDKELEPILEWLSGNTEHFVPALEDEAVAPVPSDTGSLKAEKETDSTGGESSSVNDEEVILLRRKLSEAESTINSLRTEIKAIEAVSVIGSGNLEDKVKELVRDKVAYENKLKDYEKTIDELRNEIKFRDEKSKALEEKLRFKEEEFNRHEVDLQHREELMKEQLRQIEIKRQQLGSVKEVELKKALEDLREQIKEKEEKLKTTEKYLSQKEAEIRNRENALIGKEIVAMEDLALSELRQEKVKTGTPRLDDLLLGGLPVGAQIIIFGPSFVGKEIVMNSFAAEGLRKGIPLIWVTTDKTIAEIREEMSIVINGYDQYEELGLVYYIDAYSRSIGDSSTVKNAAYLENGADIERINTMVEERLKAISDIVEKKSYRLVFRSISSLSASYDVRSIFKLMRPFVAKRKKDRSVGMYSVEKGIMNDQDVQIISSIMDGVMEFMTDGQSNFLSIQGICETQTRDRIKYTASKRSLAIGSFTLGHIK
jgi:KaiC/GvpD/RAD55 family RecA-like ATPase